ncbi:MAG TPA: glycosyltransferase family 4 protein [Solirubrobacteraceae bacterium]|nr:glycosyltransferase family 4 protein [Solirubrobacteraceae bacterium]
MSAASAPLRVHTMIDSLTWGGAEMLLGDLAAGAPAAGIELSVGYLNEIDGSPAAVRLREHGVEPVLVPVRRMLEPAGLPRLRRHLALVRPDIVHTHLTLADALGTLAARSLEIPAVSTIHLLAGKPTGRPLDNGARGRARARLVGLVRRRAGARVIAVSDAARAAYLQTGWDEHRHVVTVHNGIARAPLDGAGARVRAELGIEPDALVVSTVTVLRPGKGHDLVVEAFSRLQPRFPRLRLLILGDGPGREEIHRLLRPLGAAAMLTGHRDDVMSVLAATDVLVHPTLMDAFPTALLEAAAARVPVIATSVGGIPEIVKDGETGLLLPAPPDAAALSERLAALLDDEQLRRRLGDRAHARFTEQFTAARWAGRLRRIYDEVLLEARAGEQTSL